MFIPLSVFVLFGVYVSSFLEEFDQENIKAVWMVVGFLALLSMVLAFLSSV